MCSWSGIRPAARACNQENRGRDEVSGGYIAPLEILILIRILFKCRSRGSEVSAPESHSSEKISWSEKNDHVLEGYLMLDAMQTAMFNA